MQRGDAWAPVADRLRERYPSVLLDHATWTRDERIAEIQAAASPRAVAVGYSMGGRLALHAVLRDPGRWLGLAVIGATAGAERPDERAAADDRLAAWIERQPIETVVERWEALPVFATQTARLRAAQRPGRLSHDPRRLATLLRSAGQGAAPPVWDELRALTVPVLCLAGELDEPYARAARRMAAALPHGEARLVPGCGHAPQLEDPAAVAAELAAFLGERL